MTALQPPQLATWLLRRFVSEARHEPLIGDLLEEYRAGRSSIWYWRQVLIATVLTSYREIQTNRGLALRALALTFFLYYGLWYFVVESALNAIQSAVFWMFAGPHGLPGWPPYFDDFNRVFLMSAGVITGWSVAKLHRPHSGAMVLLCAMALPFLELPLFVAASLQRVDGRDIFDMATIAIAGMSGILIGGLLVKSHEPVTGCHAV